MSFRAVAWALNDVHRVSPSEKLTLICLAEFANDEDQTWRSREEIAYRVGCTTRSLNDFFKSLESYGLISRQARYAWCGSDDPKCAERGAHKHRSGTLYTLHLDVRRLAQTEAVSTEENISPVEEVAELSGKTHRGKNFTCGDEASSTEEKSRTPQELISRTYMDIYPPYNPPIPNQTLPDPKEAPGAAEQSVRSGQDKQKQEIILHPEEVRLIAECLPENMQALDAEGARQVAALLSERVAAGWTAEEIRITIGASPLPARVHRMAGLVTARIRANIHPDLAPALMRQQAQKAKKAQTQAALEAEQENYADPLTVEDCHVDNPQRQARLKAIMDANPTLTLTQALIQEAHETMKLNRSRATQGAA